MNAPCVETLGRGMTAAEAAQMSREDLLGVSREFILENFAYDNGLLLRKRTTGNTRKNGIWGIMHGYRRIKIRGELFQVHRIIWIMHNGYIPPRMVVDHISRDRLDNRIENLRVVEYRENCLNSSRSDAEMRCVYLQKNGKFKVEPRIFGRKVWGGQFETVDDAIFARDALISSIGGVRE